MTSIVIKKNMFMKNRYGLLKSAVYRRIQLKSFTTHIKYLMNKLSKTHHRKDKIIIVIELLEYVSRTKDIWKLLKLVPTIIKNKVFQLAYECDELKPYLIEFGYICTYTKRDGNMCCKRLEGEQTVCEIHNACKNRLKTRVSDNLLYIHTNIHSIIFKYLF